MKMFLRFFLTAMILTGVSASCSRTETGPAVSPKNIAKLPMEAKKKQEIPRLSVHSVRAEVVSTTKVLLSWSTSIMAQAMVDVHLLASDGSGTIESTEEGISSEFPLENYYKQHRLLLVSGEQLEFLSGRTYRFTVRVKSQDAQTATAPGPSFRTKNSLDLALFVQNRDGEVLAFPFPNDSSTLVPSLKISNPSDHRLVRTAYDSSRDILYFTTSGLDAILVFTNVQDSETPSETRIIKGPRTGLKRPVGISIDTARDTLYVANNGANSITVYRQASLVQGDIVPNRTVKGWKTWINRPTGLTMDFERDVLYLSCNPSAGAVVLSFFPAGEIEGDVPPVASLRKSSVTKIESPVDISFDEANEHLYVLNAKGEILVFHEQKNAKANKYDPAGRYRLHAKKAPDRIIEKKDWWMSFSPANFGGLEFDSTNNRLFVSGKPSDSATHIVMTFDNASELSGEVAPSKLIDAPSGIVSAMGLSLDSGDQILYAVTNHENDRSVIAAFDISNIGSASYLSTPLMDVQVSAFKSPISGIGFDKGSQMLYVLAGNFLAFGPDTIQSSWNYFNADQVLEKTPEEGTTGDFSYLKKVEIDEGRNILYSLNIKDNSIEAFDGFNQHSGYAVEMDAGRRITADFWGHRAVDFALDSAADTLYLLMQPESSLDRNLKVLVFANAHELDGFVLSNRSVTVTEIPQNMSSRSFSVEIDPSQDRLFVGVPTKIEIFEVFSQAQGEVEAGKVLEGVDSAVGLPRGLHYYSPENPTHTGYLLVANTRTSSTGVTGILGFDNSALDSGTDTISPIFKLTGGASRITQPFSMVVGKIGL